MEDQEQQNNALHELLDEFIVPHPYAVVDASIWAALSSTEPKRAVHFRRQQITLGSTRYTITITREDGTLVLPPLILRMINIHQTYFRIHYPRSIDLEERTFASTFFRTMARAIQEELKELPLLPQITSPEAAIVPSITQLLRELSQPIPKQRGRPPERINEWAREQVAAGRDTKEVFQEYLKRLQVDANNKQAVARARDRFRKVLSRIK